MILLHNVTKGTTRQTSPYRATFKHLPSLSSTLIHHFSFNFNLSIKTVPGWTPAPGTSGDLKTKQRD